ncbi:MAG: hypothetical protein WC005_04205 [Candidatus Nanopelagicales bacterium]
MRRRMMLRTAAGVTALLVAALALPSSAIADPASPPIPATGAFTFTTGPGILTTWAYNDLKVSTTAPASNSSKNSGAQAVVAFPVVAKDKTAVFTGGQIRITNAKTGDYINCLNPAVDTLVRVVDCVMPDKTNKRLFAIAKIGSVKTLNSLYTSTSSFTGLDLKIASQEIADWMNLKLRTNTFSPSVVFATGELTVTYAH